MGIKKYIADADNTIVNAYQNDLTTRGTGSNAGEADILEVYSIYGRQASGSQELSRVLVKFPVTDISTDRTAGDIPASGSVDFYLRLYAAESSKTVPRDYTMSFLMVSQSWQEGVGLDLENYTDVTQGNEGSNWMSASNTAYWTDINGTLLQGGSYHTGGLVSKIVDTEIHSFTQTFSNGLEDVEVNITPWVEQWIAGTYSNYGIGVKLSASFEAFASASADAQTGVVRQPQANTLDPLYKTDDIIYNPSGSTTSYYTKRMFARGTQYFFKRPVIEARWDSRKYDDRGSFYYSSSLASGQDNTNTLYLYNIVRGRLADIPGIEKTGSIMVSLFSGSADNTVPSGSYLLINSAGLGAVPGNEGRNDLLHYFVTGGWKETGIYTASLALTAAATPLITLYDVWSTGSIVDADHLKTQFHTGTITPLTLDSSVISTRPVYYMNITNLRDRYRKDEVARFNLYVRDKNWSPTIYTKANSNIPNTSIRSASYHIYRILDAYNAIPYGTGSDYHTGLSYNVSGNYFDLDMNLLEPGYAYGIKFSFYDSSLNTWREQRQTFKFRVEDYEY
tara:strand:+ start:5222 stop:6910 length:1689 start_codon:yes stop_codon:yes gene_type:complete